MDNKQKLRTIDRQLKYFQTLDRQNDRKYLAKMKSKEYKTNKEFCKKTYDYYYEQKFYLEGRMQPLRLKRNKIAFRS